MTIIECLKEDYARVSIGNRWIVWDEMDKMWVVYESKYRAKKSTIICRTDCESKAIAALRKGEYGL